MLFYFAGDYDIVVLLIISFVGQDEKVHQNTLEMYYFRFLLNNIIMSGKQFTDAFYKLLFGLYKRGWGYRFD